MICKCGNKPEVVGLLNDLYFVTCFNCGAIGYESACIEGAISNWKLGLIEERKRLTGRTKEIKQGISLKEYLSYREYVHVNNMREAICDKYIPKNKKNMWYGCRLCVEGNEAFIYHRVAEEWEE